MKQDGSIKYLLPASVESYIISNKLYCKVKKVRGKVKRRGGWPLRSKEKALEAAKAALDKKAKEILILDLKKLTAIADYFVICSGESTTQVKAITEQIEEKFDEANIRPLSIEGLKHSHWVLMDYGDIIIHVFENETRMYYELEKLWIDAKRVALQEERWWVRLY